MDFFAVLLSAVFGGIGGLIGAYLKRQTNNRFLQIVAVVVPIVLCVQLGGLVYPLLRPTTKFDRLVESSQGEFQNHPALVKAIHGMSRAEAHAFTEEKAKQGLRRLSPSDLRTWNDLRLKMAMNSPVLCAGLWTGRGLTAKVVQQAVSDLPEADGRQWIKTSLLAAILEIEQKASPEVDMEAMQTSIQQISDGLGREDKQRFSAVLISGVNANDEDACWAMKKLLEAVEQMPEAQQEPYLRALATI